MLVLLACFVICHPKSKFFRFNKKWIFIINMWHFCCKYKHVKCLAASSKYILFVYSQTLCCWYLCILNSALHLLNRVAVTVHFYFLFLFYTASNSGVYMYVCVACQNFLNVSQSVPNSCALCCNGCHLKATAAKLV